jgi:methionyl aminopeptidase
MITCKGRSEISRMERASRIVHETLAACAAACLPGVSTEEIDRVAAEGIRSRGAKAAFVGYRVGSLVYRHTICVSINDEVVHGIPSAKRKLKEGDVVGLDLGAVVDGYYGDAARTVAVGRVSEPVRELIETTHKALLAGIDAARVGARIGDIGAAVEAVASSRRYGVVREYVGHGIGTALHEEPQVPNHGPAGKRELIREGMTLAIEPMFNMGGSAVTRDADGWTIRTKDRSLSAHFEHTIAVTSEGPVVLGFGRLASEPQRLVPGPVPMTEYPTAAACGAVA